MRTSLLRPFAAVLLLAATSTSALAVCGDVTGDTKVTSADALRVLRRSVGQNVTLTCEPEPVEYVNTLGFASMITCNSYGVTANMTWSRHPGLTWSSYTQYSFPVDIVDKRVDDSEVSGQITMSFGACGSVTFDIDAWGAYFPMPAFGGAFAMPFYQASDDTVILMLEMRAIDAAAFAVGDTPPSRVAIAAVPAPPGLGNTAE